jgi:flavin-dependent thymidylate synthase
MAINQIKVELQSHWGSDIDIANCAWTSSTFNQNKSVKTDKDVEKLVKMLIAQKHAVPIEAVHFRFWLRIPIAIDRQVEKHRISSQNGMSGRYRTMPSDYLEIPDDVMEIAAKLPESIPLDEQPGGNKLHGVFDSVSLYYNICESANSYYQAVMKIAKHNRDNQTITNDEYKRLREFYRGMLPQHNMTEKVITMNLRSLANFLKLRQSPHAQPEIQEVANQMLAQVKLAGVAPVAIAALEKNGWVL